MKYLVAVKRTRPQIWLMQVWDPFVPTNCLEWPVGDGYHCYLQSSENKGATQQWAQWGVSEDQSFSSTPCSRGTERWCGQLLCSTCCQCSPCGCSPNYSVCRLKVVSGDWLLFFLGYHLSYACSDPTLFPVWSKVEWISELKMSQGYIITKQLGYNIVIFSTLCIIFPIYKWNTKACLMCRQLDNMVKVCKVHRNLWMQILNYS